MAVEKKQLRKLLIDERDRHGKEEVQRKSKIILQRLFEIKEIDTAKTISTFIGKEDEVQTIDIINRSWAAGKVVIVPVVDAPGANIYFSKLTNLKHLSKSDYDILEPRGDKISVLPLASADVIILPGLGWDAQGHRLGYGRGFYDRALKSVPAGSITIGLAFDWQILEKIPLESHDRSVDMIVTERQIIICLNRDD